MEETVEQVLIHSLCRTCLDPISKGYPLTGNIINLELDIASMLEFCISQKLEINDNLPKNVCLSCFKTIRIAYRFLKQFHEVQDRLNTSLNKEKHEEETFLFEVESVAPENIFDDQEYAEQTSESGGSQDLINDLEENFENDEEESSEIEIEVNVKEELDSDTGSIELMEPDDEEEECESDINQLVNLQFGNLEDSKIELVVDNAKSDKSDNKLYRYICPICGKKFCRADPFYNHVLGYKLSKITCPRCPSKAEFEIKEYFKHYKEFHRYHCDICDKRLVSSYGHHYHMKQHNNIKRYKCLFEGCERSFLMRHLLHRHMKNHSGPINYSCQLCPSSFNTNDALRYHLKIHDNKKDHLCTVCGRAFFQAVHLRDHMYRHLGYKKFVCDICGKGFITNSSLKKHITYCTKRRDAHEVYVRLAIIPKQEKSLA